MSPIERSAEWLRGRKEAIFEIYDAWKCMDSAPFRHYIHEIADDALASDDIAVAEAHEAIPGDSLSTTVENLREACSGVRVAPEPDALPRRRRWWRRAGWRWKKSARLLRRQPGNAGCLALTGLSAITAGLYRRRARNQSRTKMVARSRCQPPPSLCAPAGRRRTVGNNTPKGKGTMSKKQQINDMCADVHEANAKWWVDLHTGEPIKRNVGELLCLVHSEISEAMEGHRKNLPDDKLPHRPMIEVELADAVIRIFDIAAGMGLDLGGAYDEKMAYNAQRADHKREARLSENGKKY